MDLVVADGSVISVPRRRGTGLRQKDDGSGVNGDDHYGGQVEISASSQKKLSLQVLYPRYPHPAEATGLRRKDDGNRVNDGDTGRENSRSRSPTPHRTTFRP